MRWRKLGRIFTAGGERDWMKSHASVPIADRIDGDLHRVFFTSRDERNRSHVGWFEMDITHPEHTISIAEEPVIGPDDAKSI